PCAACNERYPDGPEMPLLTVIPLPASRVSWFELFQLIGACTEMFPSDVCTTTFALASWVLTSVFLMTLAPGFPVKKYGLPGLRLVSVGPVLLMTISAGSSSSEPVAPSGARR